MRIPQGTITLDLKQAQLADSVEVVASLLRSEGKELEALALFRLRTKIREGFSYEEAKQIFDEQTKNITEEKS